MTPPSKRDARPTSVIAVANEQVSIASVLRWLRVDLPDNVTEERAPKVCCPFGDVYHSDGGIAPAMRIYADTNSAYCFSCAQYFSPVSLAAKGFDVDQRTAAERLLDFAGYRPLDLAEQWQQAVDYVPEPDRALMATALKAYCRRIAPDWARRQFDPVIAGMLTRCLSVLDLVRTDEDAVQWLRSCKIAMERTLNPSV